MFCICSHGLYLGKLCPRCGGTGSPLRPASDRVLDSIRPIALSVHATLGDFADVCWRCAGVSVEHHDLYHAGLALGEGLALVEIATVFDEVVTGRRIRLCKARYASLGILRTLRACRTLPAIAESLLQLSLVLPASHKPFRGGQEDGESRVAAAVWWSLDHWLTSRPQQIVMRPAA